MGPGPGLRVASSWQLCLWREKGVGLALVCDKHALYNIESINPFPHCTINWLNPQTKTSGGLPLLIPSGSVVKNLPANAGVLETWVQSLGGKDPLEEKMATYSSILARIKAWTEAPGGLQSMGLQKVRHD